MPFHKEILRRVYIGWVLTLICCMLCFSCGERHGPGILLTIEWSSDVSNPDIINVILYLLEEEGGEIHIYEDDYSADGSFSSGETLLILFSDDYIGRNVKIRVEGEKGDEEKISGEEIFTVPADILKDEITLEPSVPSCESLDDSCTEDGYKECLEDKNGYRICGYYREEYPDCLVWGDTEFCEEYEVCIDGGCVICGDEGAPCCFNSVCEDGFQCNHDTGICEEHDCTGQSTEECGNCGVRTRTCEDGVWSDWGECTGEGECSPGTTDAQECGNNGTQERTCDSTCQWGEWGECEGEGDCVAGETRNCGNCGTQTCDSGGQWGECTGEGVCTVGANDSRTCGKCGTQIRECTASCEWGEWSQCEGEGACTPGETEDQGCGNCGERMRTCTSSCEWGEWDECEGEGVCAPGEAEDQGCGNCGERMRYCTDFCEWGDWDECEGEGVCAPGETEARECENIGTQTRTCSSTCQWGDWGDCMAGQTETWTDSASNLTWQVEPTGGAMNHSNAIAHCQGLSLEGGGWRLPTISELRSLIRGCPATETGGSCNIGEVCMDLSCRDSLCDGCSSSTEPEGGCYWPGGMTGTCRFYRSSSLVESSSNFVWVVDFREGSVVNGNMNTKNHVRCVR